MCSRTKRMEGTPLWALLYPPPTPIKTAEVGSDYQSDKLYRGHGQKVREGPQMTGGELTTTQTVKWTVLSSSPAGDSPAVVFPLKGWPLSSPSFLYCLMRYSSLGTSPETRALCGRTAVSRLIFYRLAGRCVKSNLTAYHKWLLHIHWWKIFTFWPSACWTSGDYGVFKGIHS